MGLFENFPYTNFHEINLDQIIKIMRQMQDEWQQVENDWDSMQDFINNYFDNLDVSEEVLQTLQTMAGDGELNTIIDPVIVAETAAWLAEHITPTSPVVDNTLSIAGAAADAKATGDAVADLKEDIDEIGTHTINMFDKDAWGVRDGFTMYSNGSVGTDPTAFISDFIPTSDIETMYLYPSSASYRRIVFYNSKDATDIDVVASASGNTVSNANNAPYMRFSSAIINKGSLCISTEPTSEYVPYGYKKCTTVEEFSALADTVDDIQDIVGDKYATFGTALDFASYSNTATNSTVRFSAEKSDKVGYLKQIKVKVSGSGPATVYLGSYVGTTYKYIGKFNVTLTSGVNTLINGVDFDYPNEIPVNTVIGLDSSDVSLYYLTGETSLSFPSSYAEGTYIANTNAYGVSINAEILLKTELEEIEEEVLEIQTPNDVFGEAVKASFTNDSLVMDFITAIKKKLNLVFFGTITTFNNLEIGYKQNTTKYNRIAISDTNVVVTTELGSQTYQHGLTIENNISVLIEMKIDDTAKVTIMSNGEIWSQDVTWFRMISIVSPYAEVSSSTTLTDCKMTINCEDYNKRVYAYGDSYFNYAPERWIYYANQYGFTENMLIDAHPGEASAAAIQALSEDIKHGKPKYIMWALGMNDSSDSTTYAANWKAGIDAMLAYCEQIHAVPILATVPTVATNGTVTRNNEKKNEWVRSSGYRYIDFAKAVGAGADGVWYDGMLEPTGGGVTERVHPTAKGAKALFMQACVDFPEMMVTT